MGKPSQLPPGPITVQCEAGKEQFRKLFKPFYRQFGSQPAFLKAAEAVLEDRVIHSSQITGFSTGTLKDPAPKVLYALGLFNQRLSEGAIPSTAKKLCEGKEPMVTPTNTVIGPAEVFLIFTGAIDLDLPDLKEIPVEMEAEVSKVLGKWVRLELAKRGVDFVVEDHQRLIKAAPSMKALIGGKGVTGEQLMGDLPAIAEVVGVVEAELWDVISEAMSNHLPE
jgi:hypothetical protein